VKICKKFATAGVVDIDGNLPPVSGGKFTADFIAINVILAFIDGQ
jgi:hypothetical protein